MYTSFDRPALVLFHMPDAPEIRRIAGWCRPWDGQWPQEEGFLVVPFHGQGVWINRVCDYICLPLEGGKEVNSASYTEAFPLFHQAVEEGRFQKIVLSHSFESREVKVSHFWNLCKKFPHSFAYLLDTPPTGMWMGATPEALLYGEGKEWHTMALAGTKTSPEEPWDEKNLREQAMVGNFIRQTLEKHVPEVQESERYTIQSGDLYHLRTDFDFQITENEELPALLRDLHPTPAVCGLPQKEARKFILDHEGYNRRLYAGYLGPVNYSAFGTYLAVNIRCAQFLSEERSLLYAGSGLMPDSTLESEWAEVKRKSESLLGLDLFEDDK